MSGMAGNVSAFSTVWTYDIYGAYINKKASDKHYVAMGRWSTVVGMIISIGTAYLVAHAASIMDYVQALFSFFIAPLFGTVILGMLWKRATNAGRLLGTARRHRRVHLHVGLHQHHHRRAQGSSLSPASRSPPDAQPMAENLYRGLWSFLICISSPLPSAFSPPRARTRSSTVSSTGPRSSRTTAREHSGRNQSSRPASSASSSSVSTSSFSRTAPQESTSWLKAQDVRKQ